MCYTPFLVQRKSGSGQGKIPVPCGKCPECRKRRLNSWAFRIAQEEKVSSSAYFITLTYGTNHIPITGQGTLSLSKRDLQLFIKRLRKKHDSERIVGRIKYYAVGEYGGQTVRPHYHIILFNARLEFISDAWGRGNIKFGKVESASVRYTIDYMAKPKVMPMFEGDQRVPEFSLMSKGIGSSYLTDKMVAWHRDDLFERMYCNLEDGKKVAMPRYYKGRVYSQAERNMISEINMKRVDKLVLKNLEDSNYFRNLAEAHERDFRIMGSKSKKIVI